MREKKEKVLRRREERRRGKRESVTESEIQSERWGLPR